MAIAGVKPDVNESPYVQYDEDLYTEEQVREILIKFANVILDQEDMFQERIGDSNMYAMTDESLVRGVDEFMESDGE